MKKQYQQPAMAEIRIDTLTVLAASNTQGFKPQGSTDTGWADSRYSELLDDEEDW